MTTIEWTDATWNPVKGCSRVSPGCDNCYAMRQARRQDRPGGAYEGLTRVGSRGVDWSGRVRMADPPGGPQLTLEAPLRWRKPRRVFVNSMSDLFHESLHDTDIAQVFGVMSSCPWHVFQVLTKRARRMPAWFDWAGDDLWPGRHPIPNVWLGVSAEDQQRADERIPDLLRTPAAVRFVSAEPLLGPIDLRPYLFRNPDPRHRTCPRCLYATNRAKAVWCPNDGAVLGPDIGLDWVIVGGESGPGARPCDVAWIRSIVRQCREAGVACFVKQLGARPTTDHRTRPAGEESYWTNLLKHSKGGDPSEWPEDLRVREFPA